MSWDLGLKCGIRPGGMRSSGPFLVQKSVITMSKAVVWLQHACCTQFSLNVALPFQTCITFHRMRVQPVHLEGRLGPC